MPSERNIPPTPAELERLAALREQEIADEAAHLARLRRALARVKKNDLVDLIAGLAKDDRRLRRRLDGRLDVELSSDELVAAARIAIAEATRFDPRDHNRNFPFDYEAYEAVRRYFARLVRLGSLRPAMHLALVLMRRGSEQAGASDEGAMTPDIEACLREVLRGVATSELPPSEIARWGREMVRNDQVGCLCERELQELGDRFGRVG